MTSREELLAAVRAFLREDLQPQLSGRAAYQNRIAANVLATLERQETMGPRIEALDQAFAEARGLDGADTPAVVTRALRDGILEEDGELRRYLRQRALIRTTMDAPRYGALSEALGRWGDEEQ